MVGLITDEDEKKLLEKMIAYYGNIYPGMSFRKEEKTLTHKEMGELYYTYPGEEGEVTAEEKMLMISDAIGHGYSTPIIVLKRAGKLVLLDGHRRVRVAYSQGLAWKAYVIIPSREDMEFGIEATILGKAKDLF